jgi:anti-repressor protein
VTSEVLPTIRKHGIYATAERIEEMFSDPDNIIKVMQTIKAEREERQRLERQALEDRPKVIYAEAVQGSTSSCLMGELAKMISQNGVAIGEKRLFAWMRENHYLCAYGERYNQPYQQYIEQGLFTMKQNVFSVDGEMRTRNTTKVTGKGQVYFINKFLGAPSVP